MHVPDSIKEFVWSFYPPRYKQLSEQPFVKSIAFMSKVLFVAFILTGFLYVPKVFLLRGTITDELAKFDVFKITGNVTQSAPITIPRRNPWVVVDLNDNLSITKEKAFFVIDSQTVQYRLLSPRTMSREQLKDIATYKGTVSGFIAALLILMLPGIALLLYIRTWLKYFLLVLFFGTIFFFFMELSRYRMRWKQMVNIAAHVMTPVILLEVISSFITTKYLIPLIPFLGVSINLVSLGLLSALMVIAILGCQVDLAKPKKK